MISDPSDPRRRGPPPARRGLPGWLALPGLLVLLALAGASCRDRSAAPASDPVREARLALAKGQVAKAVALYRRAVAQGPRRVEARLGLARALGRAGRLREAEQVLREAVGALPGKAELWLALGRVRVRRGRYDAAVRALQQARKIRPGDPEVALELGSLYEKHRLWEVAATHYRAALRAKRVDQRRRAHRGLARTARARERPAEAIDQLRQALALGAAGADLYVQLGEALDDQGRPAQARQVLEQGRARHPHDPALLLQLGRIYRELGEHRRAVATLRQVAKQQTDSAAPLRPLAESLLALGRKEEAYAVGVKALALSPRDARMQWLMLPLYVDRGLTEPARDLVRKLRAVRAHDPDYWRLSARLAELGGDHRAAQRDCARALTLRPRDLALRRQLGIAARRAGDYKAAVRHLTAVLKTAPKDYEARVHLAVAQEQLGRGAQAQALLEAARRDRPQRPEAILYLGWLALRHGNTARAVSLAQTADRLAGGRSAHALDVLASALVRQGRRGAAAAALDRALALPLSAGDRAYLQKRRKALPAASPPRPRSRPRPRPRPR